MRTLAIIQIVIFSTLIMFGVSYDNTTGLTNGMVISIIFAIGLSVWYTYHLKSILQYYNTQVDKDWPMQSSAMFLISYFVGTMIISAFVRGMVTEIGLIVILSIVALLCIGTVFMCIGGLMRICKSDPKEKVSFK